MARSSKKKHETEISRTLSELYKNKEAIKRVEARAKSLGAVKPETLIEPYTI